MSAPARWVYDDGGREASGMKGKAGDCTVRAWAIATGLPYQEVYDRLFELNREFAKGRSKAAKKTRKNPSPRNGVFREVVDRYAAEVGWVWTPTMEVGKGCQVHLRREELPDAPRIVVSVSRHYAAVIDGVIRDTSDPSRGGSRCVYGYYLPANEVETPEEDPLDDDGLGLDRLVRDTADAVDTMRRLAEVHRGTADVLASMAKRLERALEEVAK